MKKSVRSSTRKSSGTTLVRPSKRLPRTDTDYAAKGLAEMPRNSRRLLTPRHGTAGARAEDKTDYSALAAWIQRGMPQTEVVYTDDAPKLTQEERAEFQPASVIIKRRRSRLGIVRFAWFVASTCCWSVPSLFPASSGASEQCRGSKGHPCR